MKKIVLYIAAFTLILSCSTDDGNPCALPEGSSVDVVTQSIYIELVDSNGANLIANGTYNGLDITAEKDGFIIRPVVFDETQFLSLPDSVKDIIVLQLFGDEGENTWLLNLNDNETDELVINLKHGVPDQCGLFLLEAQAISYDGVSQDIVPFAVFESDPLINYKITVVK
ncbi:hypothetical protein MTsPCn9_17650 [Croceitalea sp. MTPC9]|uniref:hypothetical protein n=1 Tax=unclassified Croceitalea TaxID=2632280 RepID=UPI002B3C99F9|nr:hypothetical protein MTsPCn6_10500 [Croceitalea sp. MTPC6]GMN16829.1 hypothetical protein MTsPCn9_17650 [Croceitalea sp. MTPC9]